MPELGSETARIRAQLRGYAARCAELVPETTVQAAVALVLREPRGERPALLFIERAQRAGDPWSGHMAFPGGKREPGDADLCVTALRETREEVGFVPEQYLGRLDDFQGSRPPAAADLVVAAHVFAVSETPRISRNHEVQSTVWIPLDEMRRPGAWGELRVGAAEGSRLVPALHHGRYSVWGLTLRILRSLFETLGEPLQMGADARPALASEPDRTRRMQQPAQRERQL